VPHADLLINIKVICQEFSVITLASHCINYGILMIKLPYCWIHWNASKWFIFHLADRAQTYNKISTCWRKCLL